MKVQNFTLSLVWLFSATLNAVESPSLTADQLPQKYGLVGVISESSQSATTKGEQGGIAVIKEKSSERTITIKVGSQISYNSDFIVTGIKRNKVLLSNGSDEAYIAYLGSSTEKDSGPSPEEISQRRRKRFQKYYDDYKKMLEEVNETQSKGEPLAEGDRANYAEVSDFRWSENAKRETDSPMPIGTDKEQNALEVPTDSSDDLQSQNPTDYVRLSDYYDLDKVSESLDVDHQGQEFENYEHEDFQSDSQDDLTY